MGLYCEHIPRSLVVPANEPLYRTCQISSQHHGLRLSPTAFFTSRLWSQLRSMESIHLPQRICFSSTAGPVRSSLQYHLTFQSGYLPAAYYFLGYSWSIGG